MSVQEEEPTLDPDLSRDSGSGSGAVTTGEPGAEVPVGEPPLEEPPLEEPPTPEPPAGDPPAPSPPVTEPPAETAEGQFLEELSVPLETSVERDGLAPGTVLESPAGPLTLAEPLGAEARVQRYRAELPEGPVRVSAAAGSAAEPLRRQAELLSALHSPMFPRALTAFECDDRFYLVTEEVVGTTLAEALAEGALPFPQVVSVLAQVAHAVKQMHAAGWAHLGLRPSGVVLGRPARLVDLSFATRLGEKPDRTFYLAGYSPPELLTEAPVDERADVYALGALLFHAANGQPIAETGVELSTWEPPHPVGGVPQILERCLGPRESRYPSMDPLHRDLLRLKRRLTPPLRHVIAASTSIGLEPSRTTNQDAFTWLTGSVASEEGLQEWAVLCVADGMGGMAAGEVASHAAVKRLAAEAAPGMSAFKAMTAEEQVEIVKRWMHAANDSATDAMERLRVRGGATLVCGCVVGRRLTIAHVGDCRIYLLRGDEIRQLNRDHSLVMALALQGQISVEEIRNHPDRSTITRSLGDRRPLPATHVDTLEQVTGEPTLELQPGDVLLLCSDGLWEPVVEEQMQRTVRAHAPDLAAAADELVQLALQAGGPDNIAVLLFRLDQGAPAEEKRAC